MRTSLFACVSALLIWGWVGCGPPTTPETQKAELTYYKDIKPIVDAKCVNCHKEGDIGPFPLDNFKLLHQFRETSKQQVQTREMPPWQGDASCNTYKNNFDLTEEERKKFLRWVEIGAPEGDPKDEPKAAVKRSGLERVDLTLQMPVSYMPRSVPDDYRCFIVDWPETKTKFVTGFRVRPGNRKTAHHMIAYLASPDNVDKLQKLDDEDEGPGYRCFGGAKISSSWLGAWAPGGADTLYPKGTGIRVEPGSKVVLQMHYNVLQSNPEPDQSKMEIQTADSVENEGFLIPYRDYLGQWRVPTPPACNNDDYKKANPEECRRKEMKIPAGESDVTHNFQADIVSLLRLQSSQLSNLESITVHSATLHLHLLGKSARLFVKRADKTNQCVLDIPKWDFNWQYMFDLKEPIVLKAGDEFGISCTWDNSAENQPILDGQRVRPKDVYWGDGTRDEMCLGLIYVTFGLKQ